MTTTTAIPGAVRRTEPSSQAQIVVVKNSFINKILLAFQIFCARRKKLYHLMRNIIKASLRRYYPVQVIRVDEKSSLSVGMSGKCSIFCAPSVLDSVINTVKVYDALTSINIARCSGKVNLKFS